MYRRDGGMPLRCSCFWRLVRIRFAQFRSFTRDKSGRSVQDDELNRGGFAPRIFVNPGVTKRKSFRVGVNWGRGCARKAGPIADIARDRTSSP